MYTALWILLSLFLAFCVRIVQAYSRRKLNPGDHLMVNGPGGRQYKGTVIESLEGKFTDRFGNTGAPLTGGRYRDHGRGYYNVEIEED